MVGEIAAGCLVGPSVLGLITPTEPLEVLAEIGVVLLLFSVGLETRLDDLKKVGRDNLVDFLIEKANEAIEKTDLSDGARFLERDFAIQEACSWVEHKFGLKIDRDEVRDMEAAAIKERVREMAAKAYAEREVEYPVMAGIAHFSRVDSSGQRRIDPPTSEAGGLGLHPVERRAVLACPGGKEAQVHARSVPKTRSGCFALSTSG